MASRLVTKSYLTANNSLAHLRRSCSMETYMVRVYMGNLTLSAEFISVEALKNTRADEITLAAVQKLRLGNPDQYELAETFSSGGQLCKERRLEPLENPVRIQLLWPRGVSNLVAAEAHRTEYHFYLRRKEPDRKVGSWVEFAEPNPIESFLSAFLQQPKNKEYPDLCNLPDLNETTLLRNLASRFQNGNIYTYVGSILISVNPFKFYPIYNPKYVKMYQNRRLGELPPHIFAIADAAYHTMLQEKRNQCIVISGESGSGKTESTNLLLHHLSALSQRAVHGTGVEQTILGAGPVLEAFGNAKTVHNNNSSRFGKFIQVNYKENGMVHGAVVEKYLLEKSRIVSQAQNERNYHVFYYLLAGALDTEKEALWLTNPNDYFYLNQSQCYTLEGIDGESVDEAHEFTRLRQSMEMVGFCTELQRRIFSVLAAVLHLGNIEFRRKADHQHHEAVSIKNIATVKIISTLLKVKETTLIEALTRKRTTAGGETVVMSYNMNDAVQTRDAMAKCLYGGLFDWIVLQVNHALLSKQEMREHQGNSIGVLDIFGFEDFGKNSFEQFCINYANERLHYYFNQHIFKFEQEEYVREGIQWKNIEFIDNTECLDLFAKKPTGLLYLLDEECNFPGATNATLLDKLHAQHANNASYEVPQMKESAFSVVHYAGKVKYHIQDFRQKNSDLIRQDIMLVLKNSSLAFVRELVGYDPVAVLRWAIIRAFFRAYFAFIDAGRRHRKAAGTATPQPPPWNKFGAILRQQSQPIARPQHMSLPSGDMRNLFQVTLAFSVLKRIHENRKVVIVEKVSYSSHHHRNYRHVSYHGDMYAHGDVTYAHLDVVNAAAAAKDCGAGRAASPEPAPDVGPECAAGMLGGVAVHEVEAWGSEGLVLDELDSRVMRRASRVLMKSKSFKPRTRPAKTFRDLKSMKTLAGKTVLGPRSSKSKNKSPSVSAQFSHSLSKLMETLNQANPFFIRCIKSNVDKAPCKFDEEIVLRQLRYTGMLATVKIRQSGYNYRLTFDEFIHQYKILLPKGLVSSKDDVRIFLEHLDLNTENFQIGKTKLHVRHVVERHLKDMNYQIAETKVFLREAEKLLLDDALHQAIMKHIIHIQRWARTRLERHRFLRMRIASVVIQAQVRTFLAQRKLHRLRLQFYATLLIQKAFRGFRERKRLRQQQEAAVCIQRFLRGYLTRKRLPTVRSLDVRFKTQSHFARKGAVRRCKLLRDERDREQLQQKLLQQQKRERDRERQREQEASRYVHQQSPPPEDRTLSRTPATVTDAYPPPLQHHPDDWASTTVPPPQLSPQQPAPTTPDGVFVDGLTSCRSPPEDRKTGEMMDLHSSASDEGILTKESSTEELIDRELDLPHHAHGHDSEESSGILDDSEPDNMSMDGPRTKSRGSSFTTPPSTPHSPQPYGYDMVDGRVAPLPSLTRQVPVQVPTDRFELLPRLRTQQGPRDLEICIRPAIQKSASEDSFTSGGDVASGIAWHEKRISAPLAKQESITDQLEDDGSHTRRISLLEERKRIDIERKDLDVLDPNVLPHSGSQTGVTSHRSPFHRAKRHIKNIMAERTSLTESPGFESPREEEEEDANPVFLWKSTTESAPFCGDRPLEAGGGNGKPVAEEVSAIAIKPEATPLVMDAPPQVLALLSDQPHQEGTPPYSNVKVVIKTTTASPPEESPSTKNIITILAPDDVETTLQMHKSSERTLGKTIEAVPTLGVTDATSNVDFSSPKRSLQLSRSLPPMAKRTGATEHGGNMERLLTIGHQKEAVSDTNIITTVDMAAGYVEASCSATMHRIASDLSIGVESETDSSRSTESSCIGSVISLTKVPSSQPYEQHPCATSRAHYHSAGTIDVFTDRIGRGTAPEGFRDAHQGPGLGVSSDADPNCLRSSSFSSEDSRRSSILSQASTNVDSCQMSVHDSRRSSAHDSLSSLTANIDSTYESTDRYDELQSLPLETRTSSAQELSKVAPAEERIMRLERRRSSTPDTRKPELLRVSQIRHSLKEDHDMIDGPDRPEDIVCEAARISAKEAIKAQWLLSDTPSIDLTGHDEILQFQQLSGKAQEGLFVKGPIQRSKTIDIVSQDTDRAIMGAERGPRRTSETDESLLMIRGAQKTDWVFSSPNLGQQDLSSGKAHSGKVMELIMRTVANQEKLLDFGPTEFKFKERKVDLRTQKRWGLMDDAAPTRITGAGHKSDSPKMNKGTKADKPKPQSPKLSGKSMKPQTPPTKRTAKNDDKPPGKKPDGSVKAAGAKQNKVGPGKDATGKVAKGSESKKSKKEKSEDKLGSTKNVRAVCREVRQAALTKVPAVIVRDISQDFGKKKEKGSRPILKEQRSISKDIKKATNVSVQAEGRKLTGGSMISVVRADSRNVSSVSPLKRRGMHTSRVEQVHHSTTNATAMSSSSKGDNSKVTDSKVTKKSTTTTFMRYSKISFKALLREHGSGRKNSNKKDSGEDSDNSENEDGPLSPVSKYGPGVPHSTNGGPAKKTEVLPRKISKESLQADELRNKRKHRRKGSKKRREEEKKAEPMWSVSSTSQWQYPTDLLVRGSIELQQLDRFVCSKIGELSKDCGRRDTVFDVVFKGALKEFYSNLITQTSVAYHKNNVEFRYRDLMVNFEETLKARAQEQELDADFPVTIGINAFRGFLDEFNRKKENKELPKTEVKKEKKKKEKESYYEHLGHKFVLIQFSIPTYCEYCSSFMWMVEKGNVCQVCKYTVHKKCCNRSLVRCQGVSGDSKQGRTTLVIGAPLRSLLDGDQKVPLVVEKLITVIELNGLYTVGLYRKAGAAGKVKQLISLINDKTTGETIDYNDYPIHVLTSVIKCFYREMPEPLLTFELYDDFIRAAEINDEKERLQCLYGIFDKLPSPNHDLLERLIFHLANVAQHEGDNKMSANSLAIIFAPSIIRCTRALPAQQSLLHVPKQTMCLQSVITEQIRKIRHTLKDIKTLDNATATASDRLDAVRASIRNNGSKVDEPGSEPSTSPVTPGGSDSHRTEERILSEQIWSLQQEKEMLTLRMPALECRHSSSEEDILSTDDIDSTGDELDDPDDHYEEYAVTFDLPAVSPPKSLRHLNKNRVQTPTRRLPSLKQTLRDRPDGRPDRPTALPLPELKQVGEEIIV